MELDVELLRSCPRFYRLLISSTSKSFICYKIVEHVQTQTDMVVIYYFCSHQQMPSTLPQEFLRSLASQSLAANTELAPYIIETFANNGLRPVKKSLGLILEKLIGSLPSVRVVVDGLDECSQNDHQEIIEDMLRLRGAVPGACKVLFASRHVRSISKFLQDKPQLELGNHAEHVNESICSYLNPRLEALGREFDHDIVDGLRTQILAKAKGELGRGLRYSLLTLNRYVPLGAVGDVRVGGYFP